MRLTRFATWLGLIALAGILAAPAAGALVHRYTFEGGNADDAVGTLDGTVSGAVIDTADPLSPEGSYSALFGGSDYIGFGATAFNADAFSVAMWVQPGDLGLEGLLANKTGGSTTDGFALFFTSNADLQNETGNGSQGDAAATSTGLLAGNAWQHVACTIDRAGGTCGIYLDGIDKTDDSTIRNDFAWDVPWRLGALTDNQAPFDGRLDDVQVYDEILGPGAVRYLSDNPGSVIPEPVTTIGLLLGGAALTAYSRRRQRRK